MTTEQMDVLDDQFPDRLHSLEDHNRDMTADGQMAFIGSTGQADYRPTPAQETMREEMSIAQVFDETFGPSNDSELSLDGYLDRQVNTVALDVISQFDLVLGLKQWQVVQNMVEHGIRRGLQAGKNGSF